jgi:hypothetical protein
MRAASTLGAREKRGKIAIEIAWRAARAIQYGQRRRDAGRGTDIYAAISLARCPSGQSRKVEAERQSSSLWARTVAFGLVGNRRNIAELKIGLEIGEGGVCITNPQVFSLRSAS